jgi:site-specific DNA recombinase
LGAQRTPNPDCYTYTNVMLGNARAVDRKALVSPMLTGLRELMMTPEIEAEAMHAYTKETNRLNRRRSSLESTRHELAEAAKARGDRAVIEQRLAPRPVRPADRA